MIPIASALISLGSRFAVGRVLSYVPRILALVAGAGATYTVIHTGDGSSISPPSSINNDVASRVSSEVNNLVNSVDSSVSVPISNPSYAGDEPVEAPSTSTLIDTLKEGIKENMKTREKIVKAIYDLADVIGASTVALTRVLDAGLSSVAVSNISSSVAPVVNSVFSPNISFSPINNVSVDTLPIATTLQPSIDAISSKLDEKLDAQSRYYDKVLTPSSIRDLDGNTIVEGIDSIDLDNIKKAVISRALTDLNNLSDSDFDNDLDFDDILSNIDFSQLFNLIKLSNQLKNGGVV